MNDEAKQVHFVNELIKTEVEISSFQRIIVGQGDMYQMEYIKTGLVLCKKLAK